MIPHTHVDFRQESFETMTELRQLIQACAADMWDEHGARLVEICISQSQHKWLKFDRYLHGKPAEWVRKDTINLVEGVHVFVSPFEEGCANCGSTLH